MTSSMGLANGTGFRVNNDFSGADMKIQPKNTTKTKLANFLNTPTQPTVDTATYKEYAAKMDIVRVLAITSIVWGHSLFGWQNQVFQQPAYQAIQSGLIQLGRIGTINFFIISGYFFSEKVKKFTVPGYLHYRLFSLIIPWLTFITFFVLIQLVQILTVEGLWHNSPAETLQLTGNLFIAAIFHAAFWFIPVSILSACLLIVCKKYVSNLWFGGLLALITLFYSINLYHGWVSTNHARSFLGYTIFMWLGIQLKQHLGHAKVFIERLYWPTLIPAILLAFAVACKEGWLLKSIGCLDPYASIRFSNIVLSLLIFLALLKTGKMQWVHAIKPHTYIYGVYLVHSVIILRLMPRISKFTIEHNLFAFMPAAIALQIVIFACIITATYGTVVLIKKSPVRFIIGR